MSQGLYVKNKAIPLRLERYCLCSYAAIFVGAAFIIFSMKIPYPVVGSLIITWVTAPISLPS